ncbi:MAG TPA: DUF5668 domain-containing protein [Bryobacteraceae bacterium]|jgi:hypothetical protein
MSDRSAAALVCAIRGPITLITIGVLFALNNFTTYRFEQTWPVILIVFGLLSLLRRSVQPDMPAPPPYAYPPAGPQPTYPNTPYSQTTYAQPAPDAARGGFGTTAPKTEDNQTPGGAA